jgi:peptide/nickel transport system substrate-binding protein/oligopeptide transport system substrate-binding protein
VPREVVVRLGDAFGTQPVGTGPFKFVRWERGREVVLAANPDYFEGAPRLGRVIYRIFSGEKFDGIYDEFKRGGLEDAPLPTKVGAAEYARIVRDPSHVYVRRSMLSVRFYGLNVRAKPLDDRRVRQAVLHAIDRDTINNELYLGRVTTARGVLPPGMLGYNPQLAGYAYDPARARALLAEAGHPGGAGLAPIVIWATVRDERILREHEQIRTNLEAVGLRAEFQYLTDWPAFSRKLTERKLPAFLYAWFADVPDPDNFLFTIFHSASARNFMGYASKTVDDLLAQARQAGDAQRRVDLYRRAEQLIMDDAPVLPVWHYTYERLFQPYVKNVEVSSFGDPYIPLRKIWLERRP